MAVSRLRQPPRIIVVVVVVQTQLRELIALRQLLREGLLRVVVVVVGLLFLCTDIIIIIIIVVGVVWAQLGIADIRGGGGYGWSAGGEGIIVIVVHDGIEKLLLLFTVELPGQPRRLIILWPPIQLPEPSWTDRACVDCRRRSPNRIESR